MQFARHRSPALTTPRRNQHIPSVLFAALSRRFVSSAAHPRTSALFLRGSAPRTELRAPRVFGACEGQGATLSEPGVERKMLIDGLGSVADLLPVVEEVFEEVAVADL